MAKRFPVAELLNLFYLLGFSIFVLYRSISILPKIQNRTVTLTELHGVRISMYTLLISSIFQLVIAFYNLYVANIKGKSKERITILIVLIIKGFVQTALLATYIVIFKQMEEFYKTKNYDKSVKYTKILVGLDSCTILLSLGSIGALFAKFYYN